MTDVPDMSQPNGIEISRSLLIGISVGAAVLFLTFAALLIWCCIRKGRSAATSDDMYYKFEDIETVAKEENLSAGSYRADRVRPPSKKKKKTSVIRTSSYASTDDAIAAPRTSESEVKGTGVAFLDDYGRPIGTPMR